ncbi:MAG: HTH-type transcriptional activator IlvY [Xanthomonadales bacterium]|nr:HTH-type transcriptional activator IlvY [Xanthomonadales bacterium]
MNTNSFKLFVDLARSLHFAKTAEINHISPSTLSRLIQRMETELDCSLFERDNRSVSLTDNGSKFVAFAEAQIMAWQQLKISVQAEGAELSGKLRLFCSVTAAYSHLPPLLDRFRSLHPGVELILNTGDPADAISQLQQGLVDVSIAALPDKPPEALVFKCLDQVPLRIIAPVIDCDISQQLQQRVIDWSSLAYIFPEHGPAKSRLQHWLQGMGVDKPRVYARVSGHEALVSMVALGLGLGIAPQVVIDNSPVKSRVRVLKVGAEIKVFELGVCTLKKNVINPRVAAFIGVAEEAGLTHAS